MTELHYSLLSSTKFPPRNDYRGDTGRASGSLLYCRAKKPRDELLQLRTTEKALNSWWSIDQNVPFSSLQISSSGWGFLSGLNVTSGDPEQGREDRSKISMAPGEFPREFVVTKSRRRVNYLFIPLRILNLWKTSARQETG